MRKRLVHLLALSVLSMALTAPATTAAPRQHVVERPYKTPVPGATLGPGNKAYYYDCQMGIGCAIIPLEKRDLYAQIDINDAAGQDVFFTVYTKPGGMHLGDFCGSTGDAIWTFEQVELLVHIVSGVCADGSTPSVATTGTVVTTLSKKDF